MEATNPQGMQNTPIGGYFVHFAGSLWHKRAGGATPCKYFKLSTNVEGVLTELVRVVEAVVRAGVTHQVHRGETLVPLLGVAAPQVGTTQSSHSN